MRLAYALFLRRRNKKRLLALVWYARIDVGTVLVVDVVIDCLHSP